MLQREHSAILLTCVKLPFVFKTFVLSIFERPLKAGFTVQIMDFTVDNKIMLADMQRGVKPI